MESNSKDEVDCDVKVDDDGGGDDDGDDDDDDNKNDHGDKDDEEEESSDDECLVPKMASPIAIRRTLNVSVANSIAESFKLNNSQTQPTPPSPRTLAKKAPKMSIFMGLSNKAPNMKSTPHPSIRSNKKQFGFSIAVKNALTSAMAPRASGAKNDPSLDNALDDLDLDDDILDDDNDEQEKWKLRLKRDEVYIPRYRPTPEEVFELVDLSDQLGIANEANHGVAPNMSLSTSFDLSQMFQFLLAPATAPPSQLNTSTGTAVPASEPNPLLTPTQSDYDAWKDLSGNQENCRPAVIMKRGMVRIKNNSKTRKDDNDNNDVVAANAAAATDSGDDSKAAKVVGEQKNVDKGDEDEGELYELILLSRGLILAKVNEASTNPTTTSTPTKATPEEERSMDFVELQENGDGTQTQKTKSFSRALLWKEHVDWVAESITGKKNWLLQLAVPQSLRMPPMRTHSGGFFDLLNFETRPAPLPAQTEEDYLLEFVCNKPRQRKAWIDAMETVLTNYYMLATKKTSEDSAKDNNNSNESNCAGRALSTEQVGWQYLLIRKPAFTLAVTRSASNEGGNGGDDTVFSRLMKEITENKLNLNVLDSYHGYAPLHYSIRLNNVPAMQRLLQAGADPNFPNASGETPMTMAVREDLPKEETFILFDMLECFGAKKDSRKHAIQEHERGILLGKAAAAAAEKKQQEAEESVAKQQQEAAAAAKVALHENLRVMQQRGEKIEEMSNKAKEMTENAREYADLARQLKEKSKAGGFSKSGSWLF